MCLYVSRIYVRILRFPRKTEVSWRRKSADFLSEDITRSRPRFLFAVRESRGLCLFCREHSVHTIASVLDLSSVDLWIGVSRVRRRPPFSCLFARRISGILSSSRRTRGVKSLVALATRDLVVCYCDAVLSFFFFYFTWHRWKKIASPSRDALLEPRKVANKSSVAVEWREKLVRLGETWLSIIRIDMEWKVLVFFRRFDNQWEELHDFESDSRFHGIFCKAWCERSKLDPEVGRKFWLKSLICIILLVIIHE